jgi:hypothetical protein
MGLRTLRARLAALEELLPPPRPSTNPAQYERLCAVDQRLVQLLDESDKLLSAEERTTVHEALRQWREEGGGPYFTWFRDLGWARCRLPELPAMVMKDLLLSWLSPEVDGGMVCRHCGLEYPRHRYPPLGEWKLLPGKTPGEDPPPWYDLPEFFRACPGCGASTYEIDWPTTLAGHRPWMDMDGCVTEC